MLSALPQLPSWSLGSRLGRSCALLREGRMGDAKMGRFLFSLCKTVASRPLGKLFFVFFFLKSLSLSLL